MSGFKPAQLGWRHRVFQGRQLPSGQLGLSSAGVMKFYTLSNR